MKKLAMAIAVVFLGGMAGLVWGQETHDPIGPLGGKPLTKTGDGSQAQNPGNGADDLNPQPYPPKGDGSINDGGTQMRKAGGTQLTTGDKSQITGNLNGKTVNGGGKSLSKNKSSKSSKVGITNSTKGQISGNSGKPANGFSKEANGFAKPIMPGNKVGMGDGSVKGGAAGQ